MGEFCLADSVTGRMIEVEDPVVALLLRRRTDSEIRHGLFRDIMRITQNASGEYEPASLPLHGLYDGFGGVDVDPDQFSTLLVTSMTETPDWSTFANTHLTDSAAPAQVVSVRFGMDTQHAFKLFVVHASTWAKLIHNSRASDIAAVAAAVEAAAGRLVNHQNPSADDGMLVDLSARQSVFMDPNPAPNLPQLASVLTHDMCGSPFALVFSNWLRDFSGLIGKSALEDGIDAQSPRFQMFLTGLSEVLTAHTYLNDINRMFAPARVINQHFEDINAALLAKHALWELEETTRHIFDAALHDEDQNALPGIAAQMRAQLKTIDACLEKLDAPFDPHDL